MDRLGLDILARELKEDAAVLASAVALARERFESDYPGSLEACGYELNRAYNIIEKGFERVCLAFENHFEKRGDYHERLIERMSLDIPGMRPAFIPPEQRAAMRDLKGFRHVFRHAYDLALKRERLSEVVREAEAIAGRFPGWIEMFCRGARDLLED